MAHKYIKSCKNKAPHVILQHHNIQHSTIQGMYSTNVLAANKISHETLRNKIHIAMITVL